MTVITFSSGGRVGTDGLNRPRCRRLVEAAVRRQGLELDGLRVLTEAATGPYALTASIAALAGADEVLLLARDSAYGSADAAIADTLGLAREWGVEGRLRVLEDRRHPDVGLADVVTNLGFVRPIDGPMVRRLRKGAVIPLMFEAWEFREEDLDLAACLEAGVPVAGTDEHHPSLGIMEYLGMVALHLLFESGVEVRRSSILVIGGGAFAGPVVHALAGCGAEVRRFDPATADTPDADDLAGLDAVVVLEHRLRTLLVHPEGPVPPGALASASPGVVVTHIAGGVDAAALRAAGVAVHPVAPAAPGYMSARTDYVGPRPLIDLHVAGLRVGQALVAAMHAGHSGLGAAMAAAEDCPLVQPIGTPRPENEPGQ